MLLYQFTIQLRLLPSERGYKSYLKAAKFVLATAILDTLNALNVALHTHNYDYLHASVVIKRNNSSANQLNQTTQLNCSALKQPSDSLVK